MIIDFSVRNFGPFRDTAVLSMQGTALADSTANLVDVKGVNGGVLTSALVYGANASGKSYLIKALGALRRMVFDAYEEGYRYPWYEPFRLDSRCLEAPVELKLRMMVDGIRFDYEVQYTSNSIVKESLRYYPRGRPNLVFDRTGPDQFGSKAKKAIIKMTSTSSTYLAVASKYNDETCNRFRMALLNSIIILGTDLMPLVQRSLEFSLRDRMAEHQLVEALNAADFGITGFTLDGEDTELIDVRENIPPEISDLVSKGSGTLTNRRISLKHDYPACDVPEESLLFPMEIESDGTRYMFGLSGPLLEVLRRGSVLVIDEFGSHLHPLLTRWVVKRFSGDRNPNHAQLIVNTHDVGLMDTEGLRRDQIWFVTKSRETGASELYALSDYKGIRQNTDILSAYLFGRFDAIPEPFDDL